MPTAQSTNVKLDAKLVKSKDLAADETSHQATSGGNKTPQEQPEFLKQALVIIEKKVRNLEKRRQKLEEYKENQRKGKELNEDQNQAISKFEEVVRSLELARELEKQFVTLSNDTMKQQKKQAKKEQLEREEQIREKIKEVHKVLSILDILADQAVRNDFLNETNGAIKLTEQELNMLDEFYKLVKPVELGAKFESATAEASEHLNFLIDAKNKPVQALGNITAVSYQDLKKIIDRILASGYWNRTEEQPQQTETVIEPTIETIEQKVEQETTELNEKPVENQPLNDQIIYNQTNTSDDYVLVSSNDINDNTQAKSPQQQQSKTFFTTLNQADIPPHRNINEFLNRCENDENGINFLQDSEINQQTEPQQQQQPDQQTTQEQPIEQNNQNDLNQNDLQKDNRQQRGYNQRPFSQRPRYDERRSGGGMPRNGGAPPRNNGNSNFNGRNQNYRSNQPGGQNNKTGGQGGYYRNNNQTGQRNPGQQRNYQPRHQDNMNQHQQPQMA